MRQALPTSLLATLRQAAMLLSRRQTEAARALIMSSLSIWPNQPDLIQFLGSVYAQAGKLVDAEALYRKSLAVNPRQSHVLLNLGHMLRAQGRHAEALEIYRKAITIKPNDAEAYRALGIALHDAQDFESAEKAYRNALRYSSTSIPARIGLADTLAEQKKFNESIKILADARIGCHNVELLATIEQHLGLIDVMRGEYAQALAHFDKAQIYVPGYAAAEHGRGRALQYTNREESAVSAFQRAVAANPADMNVHYDLNQLLYRLGRDEEFLRSYDDAASKIPASPNFAVAKASFLVKCDRAEEALALCDQALRLVPEHFEATQVRAASLLKLGQIDLAIDIYKQALAREPQHAELLASLAVSYLMAREPAKAEATATLALDTNPYDQPALSILGTAWRMRGDMRELELNDYDKFIEIIDLEAPDGFADMASFNKELTGYLDALHPPAREYIDQSLRGGTQTLDMFGAGHGIVEKLRTPIEAAVRDFIAALPINGTHAFLGRRTDKFRFQGSWSSRLRDCGFHTNHIHPRGRISSVYYVSVPDIVSEKEGQQGWIKFGEPFYKLDLVDPVRRTIQPKPGRLILFPSYMWHGTIPFRSPQTRTTLAFDISPLG